MRISDWSSDVCSSDLLDEVAEERGVGRKFHMVDVSVEGLVHSEHQLGHACFLSALCPFVHPCRASDRRASASSIAVSDAPRVSRMISAAIRLTAPANRM